MKNTGLKQLAMLARYVREEVSALEGSVNSIKSQIEKDPVKFFQNCDSDIDQMAQLKVFREMKNAVDSPDAQITIESARNYVFEMVLRMAMSSGRSTAETSNMSKRFELEAWARLLREVDMILRKK